MFGVGQGPSGAVQLLGWLVPLKGVHRGELHTLKQQTVVGKDPTCDIVFNDSFMSSRHATIRAQGGTFVVEDHSSNGTFVNDKKVSRHELVDSDILKLGQTLVKFKQL
jgi:pSer/pThr/pTyr-binding forkhead associated (FHA) protein